MVITISAHKGGVCKSTTAHIIGCSYAHAGKSVLLVDLDKQFSLTGFCGVEQSNEKTASDVLLDPSCVNEAIVSLKDMDIIPADNRLEATDIILMGEVGREHRLKEAFAALKKKYDVIVIDTPRSECQRGINAQVAADYVIAPITPEKTGLQSLGDKRDGYILNVLKTKQFYNPDLKFAGFLISKFHPNKNVDKAFIPLIMETAKSFGLTVFGSTIRDQSAPINESQSMNTDVISYNPGCSVAQDYMRFLNEFDSKTFKFKVDKTGE